MTQSSDTQGKEKQELSLLCSHPVFSSTQTQVFFSLLPLLLSIICAATQVTRPEAAAQRTTPHFAQPPSPPRCRLSSSCPFPSASHPGASFDPGAGFLYKKDGKSPSGSSLGLGEGRWVHSEAHKHLMLLFCHAEATSGSLTLKLLHSEERWR